MKLILIDTKRMMGLIVGVEGYERYVIVGNNKYTATTVEKADMQPYNIEDSEKGLRRSLISHIWL